MRILLTIALVATALAGCTETTELTIQTTCGGEHDHSIATGIDLLPPAPTAQHPAPLTSDLTNVVAQQEGETLKIGTLLPITGDLAAFGPAMQKAADLAAMHINDAGPLFTVELVHGDSKSSPTEGPAAFNSLVNEGVAGVVGAAASSVTGSILDIAVQEQVMVVSPASTSPSLTLDRDNQGWFARVPPSDALQGKVLAGLVEGDGCHSVNILAVNNAYGQGLGKVFEETFESMGGTVGQMVLFEEGGTTFSSQVQLAGNGDPDAIVVIGYPNTVSQIVKEAFQKGIMYDSVLFFSEGVKDPDFVELVGKDAAGAFILNGLGGTVPEATQTTAADDFKDAFMDEFGEEAGLFAAETYDAVWGIALAAMSGGDTDGMTIRDNIRGVWNSPGIKVSGGDAATAMTMAASGQDIDYVGAANDFNWDENGDPSQGVYAYWRVMADGTIETYESGITP